MAAAGTQIQMKEDKPGLIEVALSVLAAALGVQSGKNQERALPKVTLPGWKARI